MFTSPIFELVSFFFKMLIFCLTFLKDGGIFTYQSSIKTLLTESSQVMNNVTDNRILAVLDDLFQRFPGLTPVKEEILMAYYIIKNAFVNDKILFLAGNGGSCADAEHMAGELIKAFRKKRPLSPEEKALFQDDEMASCLEKGLRCMTLNSHISFHTAYSNDKVPALVYAQQLCTWGRQGDVFLGISTSGNAENIVKAMKAAKAKKMQTILLTGPSGGKCASLADCVIHAPGKETFLIQEHHLPIYHALCIMLEETFYDE